MEQTNKKIDCAACLVCTWKILLENSLNKQMHQGCLRLLSFLEWVWADRLRKCSVYNRKGKDLWNSPAVADLEPSRHPQAATRFTSVGSVSRLKSQKPETFVHTSIPLCEDIASSGHTEKYKIVSAFSELIVLDNIKVISVK